MRQSPARRRPIRAAGERPRRGASRLAAAVLALSAVLAGCGPAAPAPQASAPPAGPAAVVYRTATCGCCEGHVEHLRAAGFAVREVVIDDAAAVKEDLGVPPDVWSCHTTVVDGYFVEGHVPADVIETLLARRPALDGVALPGMPAGSPGMPGEQVEPFEILGLDGGSVSVFATR